MTSVRTHISAPALRNAAGWAGAVAVYGGAQQLSAWAAQRARPRGTRSQYQRFERPAFAPPGPVFPVVWSALNLTTATSAWRLWPARGAGPARRALAWWAAAVVVRSGYVPLEFGARRFWLATADSALLCAIMARYVSLARQADPAAAALAVPEVAWTVFATVLSAAVARQNRSS